MDEKVCYNIVFYFGDRRKPTDNYEKDRLFYYKKQIEYLSTIPHNLSSIIFTINFRKEDYHYVSEIFAITPKQIGSAEVILSFRENFGLSYGGWNDTFKKYKDKYDYYIFNEDDYFFIEPNWDVYLVNKYEKSENCGYLCVAVRNPDYWNNYKKHAGHSTGIASTENLLKVWDKFNCLPHNNVDVDFKNGESDKNYLGAEKSQIMFSFAFIELGMNVLDIFEDYRVPFNMTGIDDYNIWKLYWWNEKSLIEPAFLLFEPYYSWFISSDIEFSKEFIYSTYEEAWQCYIEKKSLGDLRNG